MWMQRSTRSCSCCVVCTAVCTAVPACRPTYPPPGPLHVDAEIYAQLQATGAFDVMSVGEDEAEHSLELHTPFIAAAMG